MVLLSKIHTETDGSVHTSDRLLHTSVAVRSVGQYLVSGSCVSFAFTLLNCGSTMASLGTISPFIVWSDMPKFDLGSQRYLSQPVHR